MVVISCDGHHWTLNVIRLSFESQVMTKSDNNLYETYITFIYKFRKISNNYVMNHKFSGNSQRIETFVVIIITNIF